MWLCSAAGGGVARVCLFSLPFFLWSVAHEVRLPTRLTAVDPPPCTTVREERLSEKVRERWGEVGLVLGLVGVIDLLAKLYSMRSLLVGARQFWLRVCVWVRESRHESGGGGGVAESAVASVKRLALFCDRCVCGQIGLLRER